MMRSEGGSITVWLVGIFPLLILLFIFFVNIITLVDTKIRVQGAVDRGVYAGTSYLAYVMNRVSELNAEFRDEYLRKKKSFEEMSEDSAEWIEKQIQEMKTNQATLRAEMNHYLKGGYARAQNIAENLIRKNIKHEILLSEVHYAPLSGIPGTTMFHLIDDWSEEEGRWINKDVLRPIEITGLSIDPENYSEHSYEDDTYLMKNPVKLVALSGRLDATFRSPLMPEFFDHEEGLRLRFSSAAQPAGSSIKEYALSRSGEYHPYFIPVEYVLGGVDVEN